MNRPLKAISLVIVLAGLAVPAVAGGKATPFKLTISGGRLATAIDVTEPQLLALSDVYGGQFIDDSRSPENEAPREVVGYEVSFYVKVEENDVRKMYVVYYYPQSFKERGFLYLPGEGAVRDLNNGTIMRGARDGKWNYASPEWEALIKPAILRAQEAQSASSASERPTQKDAEFSRASEVSIDGWTKPRPGWLYVLDPRSDANHPGSRIWLVDPETAKVMGSVRAGYDPDIALSPDGSHLFVASGERESGELAVIDMASGAILHVPFPERILYKPWYAGLPPYSRMEVSADGRFLRVLVNHLFSPDKIGYQLWTFDTESKSFLSAHIHLGNCGYGEFVPSSVADQINFVCPVTNELRFIQLRAEGDEASSSFVKFPWPRKCGVVQGLLSPEGKLAIVRGDGAIYEVDLAKKEFSPVQASDNCGKRLVYPFSWPRSPDSEKVYLGYGPPAANGMATSVEFRVIDTATSAQIGRIQTSMRFWSATVTKDGRFIYAAVPEQRSVLVIDIASFEERRTIKVGQTPALALVAP